MERMFLPRQLWHCFRCGRIGKAAFQNQTKPEQVNADGLDALRRGSAGVLHRIRIDRQPVDRHKCRVRILARQDLTVDGPAAGRRLQVTVSGAGLFGNQRPATNTGDAWFREDGHD